MQMRGREEGNRWNGRGRFIVRFQRANFRSRRHLALQPRISRDRLTAVTRSRSPVERYRFAWRHSSIAGRRIASSRQQRIAVQFRYLLFLSLPLLVIILLE